MQFTSLVFSSLALLGSVYAQAPTVTVYTDAECKVQNQVITFENAQTYQCATFNNQNSQGVIFNKSPAYDNLGFNVWDSDYCDGDEAGSIPTLGECLSAPYYGLSSWKTANVDARNQNPQES